MRKIYEDYCFSPKPNWTKIVDTLSEQTLLENSIEENLDKLPQLRWSRNMNYSDFILQWCSCINSCGLRSTNGGILKKYLLDCFLPERRREHQRMKDVLAHLNTSKLTIDELTTIFKNCFSDEKMINGKRKRDDVENSGEKKKQLICNYCDKIGHNEETCRMKKRDRKPKECAHCAEFRPNIKNTHETSNCNFMKKINKDDSDYLMFIKQINETNGETLLKIPVLVEKKRVMGILDTGSTVTVISIKLWQQLDKLFLENYEQDITLANGNKIKARTEIITLSIGAKEQLAPVLISDVVQDLIIGLDSIRRFGIGITNLPITFSDEDQPCGNEELVQERITECIQRINEQDLNYLLQEIQLMYDKNKQLPHSCCCSHQDAVFSFTFKPGEEGREPKKIKQYAIPQKHMAKVDEKVANWLESKIIKKSNSAWNFPLLAVPKKDINGEKNDIRVCWDCRELNVLIKSR